MLLKTLEKLLHDFGIRVVRQVMADNLGEGWHFDQFLVPSEAEPVEKGVNIEGVRSESV